MATILEHFVNHFWDPFSNWPWLDGIDYDTILEEQMFWLERPFEEEEVLLALRSLCDDKASGPDGFPIKFFKVLWHMIGYVVMLALAEFHENAGL